MTDELQLIAFGFSFSICYGTSKGLGRHEVNVKPQDHMPLKKAEYAFSVLYVCCRNLQQEPGTDECRIPP